MRPRRRRALAAPFVVTAVLSPACGSRPPAESTPTTESAPEATGPEASADAGATEPAPPPAPEGKGSWAKDPAGNWIYTYEPGNPQIRYYPNGSCELRYVMDCPPASSCNPPRPEAVACPDGLPDEAKP